MRFINTQGWYERPIMPFCDTGVSLMFAQSEIAAMCDFMGFKVIFVKGDVTTEKLVMKQCKEDIPILNLKDSRCPKSPMCKYIIL